MLRISNSLMVFVSISLRLYFMTRRLKKTQLICALILVAATITLTLSKTVFAACSLTVTNVNDSGAGSFRSALSSASNGNTICFNIGGGGYQTINATSGYTITHSVTIDGTSQPKITMLVLTLRVPAH
jgi:hypothetical protein